LQPPFKLEDGEQPAAIEAANATVVHFEIIIFISPTFVECHGSPVAPLDALEEHLQAHLEGICNPDECGHRGVRHGQLDCQPMRGMDSRTMRSLFAGELPLFA